MTQDDLRVLYALLDTQTPLADDCGKLCGQACCFSDEDDNTLCGVDLLPAEAIALGDAEWADIVEDPLCPDQMMLMCKAPCDRDRRPWLCRIFPLCSADHGRKIRIDARSRAVCPLSGRGLRAFSPEFKEAVRASAQFLSGFEDGERFIDRWESLEQEFRSPLW